ncbi:MAG: glutaminyl-tRNA synthetase [Myxococcota bacterium]
MASETGSNFIRTRIDSELADGRAQQVVTRFPPEPNGWPHIGHAKSICLNFGLAASYGGRCHLRFDDTNPEGESEEFAAALANDVRWLGFDWGEHKYYASDYYEQLYLWAESLIEQGLAYVDESSEEEIRAHRGTVTQVGTPTPFRDRPATESLGRFRRMRAGEFDEGAMVLRAKIDLTSNNMKMRDPLMYRIKKQSHYRTGETWVIYPFYDYAHCLSDALEGITYSLCTLEFENNRELYDWYVEHVDTGATPAPQQIEFARLALTHTVTSKRKLKQLVLEGHVSGWDDPRMPTLAGLRRRGVRPEAVRELCDRVGVARANSTLDPALFDQIIREDLTAEAPRVMAVLDPLPMVVETWSGDVDWMDAPLWPSDTGYDGERPIPFAKHLFIERDDFQAKPEKGFKRLAPGRSVRLLNGYVVTYTGHDVDADGIITEVRVSHDPETRGGDAKSKVSGSIHWVARDLSVEVTVRLYDRLFAAAEPGSEQDFLLDLNPASMKTVSARIEPALAVAEGGSHWQFIRAGYFFADVQDSELGKPVFNQVVSLKDSWKKPETNVQARKAANAPGKVGDKPEPLHPGRAKVLRDLGIDEDAARVLTDDPANDAVFTAVVAKYAQPASVAKFLVNEVLPMAEKSVDITVAPGIAALLTMVDGGKLTTKLARKILPEVLTGGAPHTIAKRDGLTVVSDSTELLAMAQQAVADHPDEAQKFRDGNGRMMGFFVGKVMKATGGKADGKAAKQAVQAALKV